LLEVAGIGDDLRELLQLIECSSHIEPLRRVRAVVRK
jgi:hypothetical protein